MNWGQWLSRLAGTLAGPVLPPLLRRRAAQGKELAPRLRERKGFGAARPQGPLIWLHAASVGESLSLVPLMEALVARQPALHLLVTTGTVTSAALLKRRLPAAVAARVIHRFAPLDVPRWIDRFLDGWRPDAVAIAESEIWPNRTYALAARGIPAALVNARISPRSAAAWGRWAPGLARDLLGHFALVMAQSEDDAARLRALGASGAICRGNLKAAAAPCRWKWRSWRGCAPSWAAARCCWPPARIRGGRGGDRGASRHGAAPAGPADGHRPRHPQRGPEIAALAAPLPTALRSEGGLPEAGVEVYVADTLGEMGLFFRLAPAGLGVTLIGGSLVPKGGHNPLEPARLGSPVLLGPDTSHFREVADDLLAAGGALRVGDAVTLAETATDVLTNPERASGMTRAAATIADNAAHLPDELAEAILGLLPSGPGLAPGA
ncbi:3-deoxy-D-manno-octulosonic acid transferase [Pseudoroseomonas wenyumeiae]